MAAISMPVISMLPISMAALLVAAPTFGALIGVRFNVWALLVCLSAVVPVTTAVMLLSSYTLAATMLTAFLLVTGIEVGYLAGAYAAQAGMLRRALRPAPIAVNRQTIGR
jgi:hypothetical protein